MNTDNQFGSMNSSLVFEGDPPAAAKQIDAIRQRFGNVHVAAVLPQRRVVAAGRLVVQDDEVAHVLVFVDLQAVVLLGIAGIEAAIREKSPPAA